jgi:hypothetical protein
VQVLVPMHGTPSLSCRWREAARAYLDQGDVFVSECVQMGAMSRQRLELVDLTRAELEQEDLRYLGTLDQLEVREEEERRRRRVRRKGDKAKSGEEGRGGDGGV